MPFHAKCWDVGNDSVFSKHPRPTTWTMWNLFYCAVDQTCSLKREWATHIFHLFFCWVFTMFEDCHIPYDSLFQHPTAVFWSIESIKKKVIRFPSYIKWAFSKSSKVQRFQPTFKSFTTGSNSEVITITLCEPIAQHLKIGPKTRSFVIFEKFALAGLWSNNSTMW